MEKVLIADDDARVNELLCNIFTVEGFSVLSAGNGQEVLEILEQDGSVGLVILDVMMPVLNGWDVLGYIKEHFSVKVLMLTALDNEVSEVRGLREGADDYVAKPFRRAVLLERAKRLLREKRDAESQDYVCEGLRLCQRERKVYIDQKEQKLTVKEYQLLQLFLQNCNMVLSRDRLLDRIWGPEYAGGERTLDTHIKMLRHSLGAYGQHIRTVRGAGYCFDGMVTKL